MLYEYSLVRRSVRISTARGYNDIYSKKKSTSSHLYYINLLACTGHSNAVVMTLNHRGTSFLREMHLRLYISKSSAISMPYCTFNDIPSLQ